MQYQLKTPGKVNLYLEVKGKRADGYHELVTLFYPVTDFTDEVTLEFNETGRITAQCNRPGVPCDDDNIAVKAARKYFEASGIPCSGLLIRIRKNLPVAGGMGGGSSDAGAVLRLLQQYAGHALSARKIAGLALEIGADVPFFLNPVPSLARGRGELLEAVEDFGKLPLLIFPGCFPISAKWAYQHWQGAIHNPAASIKELLKYLKAGDLNGVGNHLRNDLSPAVFRKFPLLSVMEEKIKASGGFPLLSGSGPTLFALYPEPPVRNRFDGFPIRPAFTE